jgi:hypothetical protein
MTNYSFFIIIDTNDPTSFHIEMTKMNYRLRFSALKSNHIRKYGENSPVEIHQRKTHIQCVVCDTCACSLPGYHKILRSNYTFYLLDKLNVTAEEAHEHKRHLIEAHIKFNVINVANSQHNKFTISF